MAEDMSREEGSPVSPESLIEREDDVEALRETIALKLRPANVEEASLSPENLAFLERQGFRVDYERNLKRLKKEGKEEGMPSFEEAMAIVRSFGNKKLDALRTRCNVPTLVIAEKMTPEDFQRRQKEGRMRCDDIQHPIFFGGKDPDTNGFSVGIVEGLPEPESLKNDNNPDNYLGEHYDAAHASLDEDGLRSPQGNEYVTLFDILKAEGIIIDQKGNTLLDRGKRVDATKVVPLGYEYNSGPNLRRNIPTNQYDNLHVRPSAWGDHVAKA